jgi:tRNA 2-thiouridine synthesizing protein A
MEDPPENADTATPDVVVDARGHRCPVPTLRLRRALDRLGAGQRALLIADDPMARIDVPLFVSENGHRLLDLSQSGEVLRFLIEKG